jgi:hypothetical protein
VPIQFTCAATMRNCSVVQILCAVFLIGYLSHAIESAERDRFKNNAIQTPQGVPEKTPGKPDPKQKNGESSDRESGLVCPSIMLLITLGGGIWNYRLTFRPAEYWKIEVEKNAGSNVEPAVTDDLARRAWQEDIASYRKVASILAIVWSLGPVILLIALFLPSIPNNSIFFLEWSAYRLPMILVQASGFTSSMAGLVAGSIIEYPTKIGKTVNSGGAT